MPRRKAVSHKVRSFGQPEGAGSQAINVTERAMAQIPIISVEQALTYAELLNAPSEASRAPAPSASSASSASLRPSGGMRGDRSEESKTKKEEPKLLQGDFGQRIELLHAPQIQHKSPFFPHGHLSIGIVGASGCGKSYLLLSILPQIAKLTQVIICSRVRTPVYDQIQRWCESSHPPIAFAIYNEPETADSGIREMTEEKPEGSYGIIIFDDFSTGTTAHSDKYMKVQNVCTMMKRNDGYHSCIITQQYTNISTKSRNNANILFAFTMHDIHAVNGFARHVNEATGILQDDVRECFREITMVKHSYMLLIQEGGTGRLFAKRGPNLPIEEVEIVTTRIPIADIIRDPKLVQLFETEEMLQKRPQKSTILYRELKRVRENIQEYIEYLARENDVLADDIRHELFICQG